MAGFKFNFTLPDSDWSEDCNPEARSLTETCHSLKSTPVSQPSLHHGCHKLNEVLLQPFHEQLLNVISSIKYPVKLTQSSPLSPPPLPPPTLPPSLPQSRMCENVTLHYITADQLQSLLDKERRKDSVEQVLNLKSDTDVEMIAQLSSELGPLLSVANSVHSDLIPGVYEGGMKIWECAHDLIEYLATESAISLCGRRVLELGCGVGLPGIFALLCGAECAHFQDFNCGVLNCMTIPSVLASMKSGQPKFNSGQASMKTGKEQSKWIMDSRTKFYFGEWVEFAMGLTQSGELPYDIILTSETIYSIPSQPRLLHALKMLTNQNGGLVIVAAKTHYFGVGGSVQMFQDLVAEDGFFEATVGRSVVASVPRKILLLRPKTK